MAEKPRVKAPKQRAGSSVPDDSRKQRIIMLVGGLAGIAAVLVVIALLGASGGGPSEDEVRTNMEAAGCTFEVAEALEGEHSIAEPGGSADVWNTDPPTTGPHYAIAAIFGIYEEPLELARVLHNLEHGGIYILYGDDVPDATVSQLRDFYDGKKTGTLMAPLPRLGDEFALGAWNSDGESGNGYLAKCKEFDEDAVSSFFSAFQFRGPERFDPSQLRPGS